MNVRARIAPLLFIGAFASARIDAQQSLVIRDPGPGPVGRRVATALAGAHLLIPPAPTPAVLPRDDMFDVIRIRTIHCADLTVLAAALGAALNKSAKGSLHAAGRGFFSTNRAFA